MADNTSKKTLRASKLHHFAAGFMTLALAACDSGPAAPPVRPGEAPLPCAATSREVFAIDDVIVPFHTADIPRELDIDHNGRPEAGLDGMMEGIATIGGAEPSDWRPNIVAALAARTPWLLVVETCSDSAGPDDARVRLVRGVDVDGDGVLELGDGGSDVPAGGTRAADGSVVATDGSGEAPLGMLFDPLALTSDPGWQHGEGLSIVLGPTRAGGERDLTLGLAFTDPFATCAPGLAAWFTDELRRGHFLLNLDSNGDSTVSVDEFGANKLIQALFADDVDLYDGDVYAPHQDKQDDHESLTLRVQAHAIQTE